RHHVPFARVEAHRLLAVDVLAGLERGDGDERVPVRGSRDHDRVDIRVRDQIAEVVVALRFALREGDSAVQMRLIDVANGAQLDVRHGAEGVHVLAEAASGHPDEAQNYLFICGDLRALRAGRAAVRWAGTRPGRESDS